LLIAEVSYRDRNMRYHLRQAELAAISQLHCRRVILTHMSTDMFDDLDEIPFDTARDGVVITIWDFDPPKRLVLSALPGPRSRPRQQRVGLSWCSRMTFSRGGHATFALTIGPASPPSHPSLKQLGQVGHRAATEVKSATMDQPARQPALGVGRERVVRRQ
jgi:hypothetical protein